jgi:hypothetical protein
MSCDFSLKYHSAIRREKRTHWRQFITDLPRCNTGTAAKYVMADPGSSPSSSLEYSTPEKNLHIFTVGSYLK